MPPHQRLALSLASLLLLCILAPGTAAAEPVSLKSFRWHDFDERILQVLGFQSATVVFFSELGSVTPEQLTELQRHERVGCNPFLVLKDSQTAEKGYNCRTFFCVGYLKGPKHCQDYRGKPYGGVAELTNRLGKISQHREARKDFAAFPQSDQTDLMRERIKELARINCRPFYTTMFDVLVGEGYECNEVGAYPYFSSSNVCRDDWRDSKEAFECRIPERKDEFLIRAQAIELRGGGFSSTAKVATATGSSSSSAAVRFPDILEGRYGYTAITSLAAQGVIRGYPDGTFRPSVNVNRAEFLHLLIAGLHPDQLQGEHDCFPDTAVSWYSPAVCAARRLGWVQGYGDGTFRPQQSIRRDEGLKIVIASLGIPLTASAPLPPDVAEGTWFTPYARTAMEHRLILEPTFRPMQLATRADAAVWMFRALRAKPLSKLPEKTP